MVFVMEVWCFYEVRNEIFKHTDAFFTLQMVKTNRLLLRRLQFSLSTHLALRCHVSNATYLEQDS
jgi:hypothetical protein